LIAYGRVAVADGVRFEGLIADSCVLAVFRNGALTASVVVLKGLIAYGHLGIVI
jgi:hypothetical protein